MKQITLTLATVILCVTFAGCSGGACSHDFSEWMTHEEANCMSQKVQRRNCLLCNRVETRRVGDINSNAHLGLVNAVAPTCQTVGNTGTGTCTRPGCGKTVTGTEIPINPNAHDRTGPWTYNAIAATCTKESIHIRICNYTDCDAVAEEMLGTIGALGHSPGNWVSTATCTEDGIETGTCTNDGCNEPNPETRVEQKLGHDHESSLVCKRTDCNHQYAIGDTGPAGGKISYVAETGFDLFTGNTVEDTTSVKAYYLEAALADITGTHAWASSGFTSTEIETSSAIGRGRKNTNLILAVDVNAPAAKACRDYRAPAPYNTFDDWFLPSSLELNQLYLNKDDVGGFTTTGEIPFYWSSLQGGSYDARYRDFSDGPVSFPLGYKTNLLLVRPIRAF